MRFALALSCLVACTSDATGPEGALELALTHARPMQDPAKREAAPATRVEAKLELAFTREATHTLFVERQVDQDGRGRFRVSDLRSERAPSVADPKVLKDALDGVESVFDGHRMALKRRDGPWIERDTLDGLATRTLADALGLGDFVMQAFGDYLRLAPLGPSDTQPMSLAGVAVSWFSVELDPAVRPRPMSDAELAMLKDHEPSVPLWIAATHRPTKVAGALARNASGAIVAGALTLEGETPFPEGPAKFTLTFAQTLKELPADADFALPAERLPESRERPWLMIEDVLGDELLPPYKPAK